MAVYTSNPLLADFTSSIYAAGNLTGQNGWTAGAGGTTSLVVSALGASSIPGNTSMKNFYPLPFFTTTTAWTVTMIVVVETLGANNTLEINLTVTSATGNKFSLAFQPDDTVNWSLYSFGSPSSGTGVAFPSSSRPAIIRMSYDGVTTLSLYLNNVLLGSCTASPSSAVNSLRLTNNSGDVTDTCSIQLISVTQPVTLDLTNLIAGNVKKDIVIASVTGTYDPITGNYTDPGIAHVEDGTTYKFAGVDLEGTLAATAAPALRQRGRIGVL